jgi:hypothetical protein
MNTTLTSGPLPENSAPGTRRKRKRRGIGSFFRWFFRNRRIQALFFILVFALPVFLIIYGIIIPVSHYMPSPSSAITPISSNDTIDSGFFQLDDTQRAEINNIISLENELAFEKNRLNLAEKDSIYMILDLPDSLLLLEIKGVTIKKAKILDIEMSHRFALISHENMLPWIAEPFILERDLSTIPKSPIVIKQAPKDTIEAAKMSSKPAPPDSTNVFFTLYFDKNLVLEVEQGNPREKDNTEKVKTYRSIKKEEMTRSVFKMLQKPQQTDQPMLIKLVINEVEARSIYRAVPVKTRLVLKL